MFIGFIAVLVVIGLLILARLIGIEGYLWRQRHHMSGRPWAIAMVSVWGTVIVLIYVLRSFH